MTAGRDALALEFARICSLAGEAVMAIYASDFEARAKSDRSPVTDADEAAEAIILQALTVALPGVPVLAEESFGAGARPELDSEFLLVDPVDGTKEFISRNGEFTLNIALIVNRTPVAGCVFAPAKHRIYLGGETACVADLAAGGRPDAAALTPIRVREPRHGGLTAVMSRSHADEQTRAFAKQLGVTETVSAGSSLKFCLVAEGAADVYPRFGPTSEWDTAAGHAVLAAAGGCVTQPDGRPFLYAKSETGYRNGPFVAWGGLRPG